MNRLSHIHSIHLRIKKVNDWFMFFLFELFDIPLYLRHQKIKKQNVPYPLSCLHCIRCVAHNLNASALHRKNFNVIPSFTNSNFARLRLDVWVSTHQNPAHLYSTTKLESKTIALITTYAVVKLSLNKIFIPKWSNEMIYQNFHLWYWLSNLRNTKC